MADKDTPAKPGAKHEHYNEQPSYVAKQPTRLPPPASQINRATIQPAQHGREH